MTWRDTRITRPTGVKRDQTRPDGGDGTLPNDGRRIGTLLLEAGEINPASLASALREQSHSGGRLGQILVAEGSVRPRAVTSALSRQLGVAEVGPHDRPIDLLPVSVARRLRSVALATNPDEQNGGAISVAVVDSSPDVLTQLEEQLGQPVVPKLGGELALEDMLRQLYAERDAREINEELRSAEPELSAYSRQLSMFQLVTLVTLGILVIGGLVADAAFTATVAVGLSMGFYVLTGAFRIVVAAKGWRAGPTVSPTDHELDALSDRELPTYTVLVPLLREKVSTLRVLFDALRSLDYPKHKLDGILLVEVDDVATLEAIAEVRPLPWLRTLVVPDGKPRTKPRAMLYGLRYARGEFLTVYDAEDKPDPLQLKKAVWGFRHLGPEVGCLQASLSYYNPRQNLLTRWFTLEYDSWFGIFVPGLQAMGAPIPLGGTSNHFPVAILNQIVGWDPFNVTEDADLGVRLARRGFGTAILDSTTYEEANSRTRSWLRQRSRWIKGYMQTLLVHTRHPRTLVRDLGVRRTVEFLAVMGTAAVSPLISLVFWALLVLWVAFEPHWIAQLLPGPVYYASLISFVLGNLTIILLGLVAAVERGHDDLSFYSLLIPLYWLLMSVAALRAFVELIVRPHHWHKTEHGLHLDLDEASA